MSSLRLPLTLIGALTAAVLLPTVASAATTFGSDLAGSPIRFNDACTEPEDPDQFERCVVVRPDASPVAGVLTGVRIKAADSGAAYVRVLRPAAGSDYTLAGSGRSEISNAVRSIRFNAGTSTLATRIPIAVGDRIGLENFGGGVIDILADKPAFLTPLVALPSDAEGVAATNFDGYINLEPLMQGSVEPDADGDGYGDETQDKCPTRAEHQLPCSELAVSSAVDQAAVLPGGALLLKTTVTNRGPSPSPIAQLQMPAPPAPAIGLAFTGAACTVAPAPTCTLPALAVGASVTISRRVENVRAAFPFAATVIAPTSKPATWVLLPSTAAASGPFTVPTAAQLMLGVRVLKGKTPRVEVSCPKATPDDCAVEVRVLGPKGLGRLSTVSTFRLAAGSKTNDTIRLSREGQRLLRKRGKLAARVQVTRTEVDAGVPLVVTRALPLGVKKRR